MRRQTKPHGLAARWPLCPLDLDPFQLPVRYSLPVSNTGGQTAEARDLIEIFSGTIAVEHTVDGVPPVRRKFAFDDFSGVAIRIESLDDEIDGFAVSVNLHHPDPKLCFPLHMSFDMCEVGARWQSWGRALKLPLLLPARDGGWREPVERLGKLVVNPPYPRTARLSLRGRRSAISSVRETGDTALLGKVAGTEIVARS